jgi:hypothetical protein
VRRRSIVDRRYGPSRGRLDDVVLGCCRRRRRRDALRRLVQDRAVQPDDGTIRVVVFDFCRFVVLRRVIVRREVTVRDGVMVIVGCARLVDVLRRER